MDEFKENEFSVPAPSEFEDISSGRESDDKSRYLLPSDSETDFDAIPEPPDDPNLTKLFDGGYTPSSKAPAPAAQPAETSAPGKKKKKKKRSFIASFLPVKGDKPAEVVRKLVLTTSICTMIVCCGILLNTYYIQPTIVEKQNSQIQGLVQQTEDNITWDDIYAKYPDVDFPAGMQLKYAELYAANHDLVGYFNIDGMEGMSFAVLQGETNDDYLRTDFYGEYSKYGSIFVDYRTPADKEPLGRNTVIHGHNMKYDDKMFGKLENYRELDTFKASPIIQFNTLFRDYKWKIYAVFLSDADIYASYFFNYCFAELSSDAVFAEYIDELDQRKLYDTGVDMLPTDKILTLSTCTYDFDDARLVVVARMVRDGENPEVDTSKAEINPSVRYPDTWYSNRGKTNPFKNGSKWYPG